MMGINRIPILIWPRGFRRAVWAYVDYFPGETVDAPAANAGDFAPAGQEGDGPRVMLRRLESVEGTDLGRPLIDQFDYREAIADELEVPVESVEL